MLRKETEMNHDEQLLQTADHNGLIRISGDYLRSVCLELVREGRLVQISRYTFSIPEGG